MKGASIVGRAWRLLAWTGLVTVLALLTLLGVARHALKPAPGVWATRLHVGPVTVPLSVPSAIWLATTPWVGPLLDQRTLPTRMGDVKLGWQGDTRTLTLQCAPCRVSSRGWGETPLVVAQAQATVRRTNTRLEGVLSSGQLQAHWHGELLPTALNVELDLPTTSIREVFALFADTIPEVAQARIDGEFSLQASVSLPAGPWVLKPQVKGFAVQGLGTEALVGARSSCQPGGAQSGLGVASALARAVVAAEDQRFLTHTGFDLTELNAAFALNQQSDQIERGASTLSQQLARLLVTGSERTPTRKLRELLYAVEMEQTLGKARILGLYLDHAPWGNGLCGAEAAAFHYFGIRARALDAAQSVWLAAMLHNPNLEATAWTRKGHINLARAQWVASNVRPSSQRRIDALVQRLSRVNWTVPQ